jgi:hypothetical protein
MSVFRLTMLPANEGDCLILSYGRSEEQMQHIVIDGGRKASWPALKRALKKIASRGESVELLVLSHIDADHIDGLLAMVQDPDLPLRPKELWYNGFDQLAKLTPPGSLHPFGFKAADAYSKALADIQWPVNARFGGKPILVDANPVEIVLGDLRLHLLSPDFAKLDRLRKEWRKWRAPKASSETPQPNAHLHAFGKRPMPAVLNVETLSGPSNTDSTLPNGTSIAFVAEYEGRRVLLGADAHPDVLLGTIPGLAAGAAKLAVDLVKLPHHGSRANLTRALLEAIDCNRFAISTSGVVFGHPDPEAISRILRFASAGRKMLYFNYASDRTLPWDNPSLQAQFGYECVFPKPDGEGLTIDI